ncbi:unnamed protein product [Penicillium glandicola]
MKTPNHARGPVGHRDYGKLAIATASILGVLTFGALIFLLVWYVRRRLRAQRCRREESQENDQFDQSAVSLAEDTTSSSTDTHTLTQISTQESSTDEPRSDQTQWSSSGRRSSSTTPRASISSSVIPTSRSSQIWTTTSSGTQSEQTRRSSSGQNSSSTTPRASISSSVGTERFSLLSQSSNYTHRHQSPTGPSASRSSQVYMRRSNTSGASSRPSSAGVLQSASRMFNEAEASRMAYSRNIDSIGSMSPTPPISPVLVDVSAENDLPQWTSVPPTPFPFSQP